MTNVPKAISAEEFDRLFDEGSDEIDQYIDWSSARRINQPAEPLHVDLPGWMAPGLDAAAARAGITRQALLEDWIAARLHEAA